MRFPESVLETYIYGVMVDPTNTSTQQLHPEISPAHFITTKAAKDISYQVVKLRLVTKKHT